MMIKINSRIDFRERLEKAKLLEKEKQLFGVLDDQRISKIKCLVVKGKTG